MKKRLVTFWKYRITCVKRTISGYTVTQVTRLLKLACSNKSHQNVISNGKLCVYTTTLQIANFNFHFVTRDQTLTTPPYISHNTHQDWNNNNDHWTRTSEQLVPLHTDSLDPSALFTSISSLETMVGLCVMMQSAPVDIEPLANGSVCWKNQWCDIVSWLYPIEQAMRQIFEFVFNCEKQICASQTFPTTVYTTL